MRGCNDLTDAILYGPPEQRGQQRGHEYHSDQILEQLTDSLMKLQPSTHLRLLFDRKHDLSEDADQQQYEVLRLLDQASRQTEIATGISLSCTGFSGVSADQPVIFEIKDKSAQIPNRTVFSYHRAVGAADNDHAVALEYVQRELADDLNPGAVLLVSSGTTGRRSYRTHNLAKELQNKVALHLLLHQQAIPSNHTISTQSAYQSSHAGAGVSVLLSNDPQPSASETGLFDSYWLQISLASAINDLAGRQKSLFWSR